MKSRIEGLYVNDLEIGKLIAAVEQLTKTVDSLSGKVEILESQLDKGKGVILGIFLLAGALGTGVGLGIDKVIKFIGG